MPIILLSLVAFASCRKDPIIPKHIPTCDTTFRKTYTFDTIYPSEYLMAYPGSWWEYDNASRVDCENWEYIPVLTQSKNESGCLQVESNYAYYPKIAGAHYQYVAGNSGLGTNSDPFKTNISKLILKPWETEDYIGSTTDDYVTKVWKELHESFDSLEVGGIMFYDVIDVRTQSQISYYELDGAGPMSYTHNYYSKGIGLIQTIQYYNTGSDETGAMIQKLITGFYIAPH
ncbi:MAG: hypothetical protein ACI8ZM_000107 [Crocinitomix sp.]|jgi:hypothetical protein